MSSEWLNPLPLTVEFDNSHGSVAKIHRLYSNTKEKSAKYLIGTIFVDDSFAEKKGTAARGRLFLRLFLLIQVQFRE